MFETVEVAPAFVQVAPALVAPNAFVESGDVSKATEIKSARGLFIEKE